MLALLRAASEAPADLEAAFDRLLANVRADGEPPPDAPEELRSRLGEAMALLVGAGALATTEGWAYSASRAPRGPQLLNDLPGCGVDQVGACTRSRSFVHSWRRRATAPSPTLFPCGAFEACTECFQPRAGQRCQSARDGQRLLPGVGVWLGRGARRGEARLSRPISLRRRPGF